MFLESALTGQQAYSATNSSATPSIDFDILVHLTGGRHGKHDTTCPVCSASRKPVHRKLRVLRIWQNDDDFVTFCCAHCGLKGYASREGAKSTAAGVALRRVRQQAHAAADLAQECQSVEKALTIWRSTVPIKGTLAEEYLRRERRLKWDCGLDEVLRFHRDLPLDGRYAAGIIGLFRDITSDEPCGIQRIFLNRDGRKIERRMLGRSKGAAIKLDPDEDVTLGLYIGEGIETCLAGRQLDYRPAWALGCVNAIGSFPVLAGIEALTIFIERNEDGTTAQASEENADICLSRYLAAGFNVDDLEKCDPPFGDLNDVIMRAGDVSYQRS
jgi:hypothetical protein